MDAHHRKTAFALATPTGEPIAKRILIVEDEKIIALDLKKTLVGMGYLVSGTASSAAEALAQASKVRPDLVLMDIHLRGNVDGIETAAQLRERFAVPIVFLTGNSDESTLRKSITTDPDGYLLKPFDSRALRATIELALSKHNIERELQRANEQLAAQKCELEERQRELRLLTEMGELLQISDNEEEVLAIAARFGGSLFPTASGGIYLFDPPRTTLETAATWPGILKTAWSFPTDECRALRKGQMHRVVSTDHPLRCAHHQVTDGGSSLCVPLIAGGNSLGVLSIWLPAVVAPGEISQLNEQLAASLGQRIAVTLGNIRNRQRLHKESILDPLTGLFNRRHLEATLKREIRLAGRAHRSFGVLMLDLDNFKHINDSCGHLGADAALSAVGDILRSRLRSSDVPSRFGGDEMMVLLPDTVLADAVHVAEKLRLAICGLTVRHAGQELPALHASFGVAAFPEHGADMASLIHAADGALYQAKAQGRNRVVIAGSAS